PPSESTSVLPGAAAASASGARPTPAAARRPRPEGPRVTSDANAGPVSLPLRLLAWAAALVLGLVVTVWIARITGWLSGDRLVAVFPGPGGMERYLRVLALAPVWALFTTGLLTLFLDGGRALARRRAEVHADRRAPTLWQRFRRAQKPLDPSDDEPRDRSA